MHVVSKDGARLQRWDELEPGSYSVEFQHRTMDDLRALNPEGREEEQLFSTLAQLSELNASAYKTWVRPWLQMLPMRAWGEAMTEFHPLRWQRRLWSDSNPLARLVGQAAEKVRAERHAVAADHPGRQWEAQLTDSIETALNQWRDQRDQSVVQWTRLVFGPWGLGALCKPAATMESTAVARALEEIELHRQDVLAHVAEGGPAQAVCRIVLAGMTSLGNFERRSFRLASMLAALQPASGPNWLDLMRAEARIAAVAPVEALNSLGKMLPTQEQREHALAVAAAVMMIEPTLDNPRSEIIELLIGMLDLDATHVMDLACSITASLGAPGNAVSPTAAPAALLAAPMAALPGRRAQPRLPAGTRRAVGAVRRV
jgi:hypothetical protein